MTVKMLVHFCRRLRLPYRGLLPDLSAQPKASWVQGNGMHGPNFVFHRAAWAEDIKLLNCLHYAVVGQLLYCNLGLNSMLAGIRQEPHTIRVDSSEAA